MKMKNVKKILSMILVCIMVGTFLAGCSESHKDWEEIGPKGKMIIGMTDFIPMNYKDGDGKWIGFETEFAEAVCEILGVDPEFIEIDWGSKETELKSKNIDCIWNGMTVTPAREKEVDFSVHYMTNRQVVVTRSGNEDKYQNADGFEGAVVVAEQGSTGESTAQEDEFFSKATYNAVDKQITALLEVKSGTADVAVVDYFIAANAINGEYGDLIIVNKTFPDEEYAIAFRKNSPKTLEKVNDAIKQLQSNGKLKEIADNYGLYDLILLK